MIVKRVSMPLMTEEELYDRIQAEASQHIPVRHRRREPELPASGSHRESDGRAAGGGEEGQDSEPHQRAGAGGQDAVVVDIDAFALQNCFEVNYEPDPSQVVALLNVGASVMNINIIRGWTPLFTRDVSVGGNQYTDALQKELDLSFEDAEKLKMGGTLPA